MAETNVSTTIEERIATIREEQGDQVSLDSVAAIVGGILGTIRGDIEAADLAPQPPATETFELPPTLLEVLTKGFRETKMPETIKQLTETVEEAEEATNIILSAGEALEELADTVDEKTAKKIHEICTNIYQASNFQDIGGQRINKVLTTVREIITNLDAAAAAIGELYIEENAPVDEHQVTEEENLLHGPQLHQDANTQAEIDALLASFD